LSIKPFPFSVFRSLQDFSQAKPRSCGEMADIHVSIAQHHPLGFPPAEVHKRAEIREPALVSFEFLGRLYGLPSGRLNTSS
jgi:predicted component of type VI protein secretion system